MGTYSAVKWPRFMPRRASSRGLVSCPAEPVLAQLFVVPAREGQDILRGTHSVDVDKSFLYFQGSNALNSRVAFPTRADTILTSAAQPRVARSWTGIPPSPAPKPAQNPPTYPLDTAQKEPNH